MMTFELPRDQWKPFFDEMSHQYRNWKTVVEVMKEDLGDQPETEGSPLQEIIFEPAGTEQGSIEIALGETADSFQTHLIERPEHVRVADTQPGTERDIQIESADGITVLVRVQPYSELPQTH
ncbi:MAG TPA: DUF5335 family protein [Tepidisphaeraceae bacterium]|nr:DUF5335 family protein [Tepidisphaeraceae bacterium]